MGKRERRKGSAFEREVAARLRAAGVADAAKRGIGQARSASEVPDVDGTRWWVEAKHRRAIDVHGAYNQAVEALAKSDNTSAPKRKVLVITRRDREATLATVELDYFLAIVRELLELGGGDSL